MAYVDQFEHLIQADERGRAIKNTRTVVVFDDGLVVCDVPVHAGGRPAGGPISALRQARRAGRGTAGGDDYIRPAGRRVRRARHPRIRQTSGRGGRRSPGVADQAERRAWRGHGTGAVTTPAPS